MADFLSFIALLAALALPFHWAVTAQLARCESPEYFRRYGVIVLRMEALDARTGVIGHYHGASIHGSLIFKGMKYDFAGVVPPRYRSRIGENELYLDPGLLYVFRAGGRRQPAPYPSTAPAINRV